MYSTHKNAVITITLFWFCFLNLLSSTSPFESWIYGGYNFALGWPIVWLGVWDRDISDKFASVTPVAYGTGRTFSMFTTGVILDNICNACVYGVAICIMVYIVLELTFVDYGLYDMGTLLFFAVLNCMQAKVSMMLHQWNFLHISFMIISVGGTFLVCLYVSAMDPRGGREQFDYYYVMTWTLKQGVFWISPHLLIPITCIMTDFLVHAYKMFFYPDNQMILREHELQIDSTNVYLHSKLQPWIQKVVPYQDGNGSSSSGSNTS